MHQPLVSIITAFLNEERFLAEAIESVLAQDYPHWELLLVDDGSTDHSTGIARQYAARFPGKIVYCEHAGHVNKGLSASRNHGIAQARGPLIAVLDADDIWRPGKLANQVNILRQHPEVAMVAEASLYWYSWNAPEKADVLIPVGAPAEHVYRPTELQLLIYPLRTTAAPCPSGLMLTKQAWLTAGGFEESFKGKYQLYEDQAFLSKIYAKEHVYISSSCNNLYRQRLGSIVQAVKEDGHYHSVRQHYLEWLALYLRNQNITDKKLNKLLNKAMLPYQHPTLHYFMSFSLKQTARKFLGKIKRTVLG